MSRQPVALTLKERFIGLRVRQRQVLEAVFRLSSSMGYPPTIQQLCDVCELRSTSSMHYHLSILKQMGLLQWDTAKKRSVNLPQEVIGLLQDVNMGGNEGARASFDLPSNKRELTLPMLGTIAAGSPLLAPGDSVESIDFAEVACPEGCYALKVKGFSMIEDHIMDGDIVVVNPAATVRDGDVVVALVDGDAATLKRIYREKTGVRLQPANAEMEPIFSTNVLVQGKVESIVRRMY